MKDPRCVIFTFGHGADPAGSGWRRNVNETERGRGHSDQNVMPHVARLLQVLRIKQEHSVVLKPQSCFISFFFKTLAYCICTVIRWQEIWANVRNFSLHDIDFKALSSNASYFYLFFLSTACPSISTVFFFSDRNIVEFILVRAVEDGDH